MKALEEMILREGKVLPGQVLKVGSFLNQQIDVDFLMEMGRETARLFADAKVNKVLTIESSGIAVAICAAAALHVPMLFGKKHQSTNISGSIYSAPIHSYTHGNDYNVVVPAEFLHEGDRVLLVDDFLANGCALEGMMELCRQAGAEVVGACCAVEKGFQHGGDRLREKGVRVESLAIVESMDENSITFRS